MIIGLQLPQQQEARRSALSPMGHATHIEASIRCVIGLFLCVIKTVSIVVIGCVQTPSLFLADV